MKTKEQVLAIKSLNAQQRKRAEDYFMAQERFHKPLTMPCSNEKEVVDFITRLENNYKKRKEAEARRAKRITAKKEELAAVIDALNEAKSYGFTTEDVISVIKETVKAKKNEKILKQIEELKSKLV